MNAFHLAFFFIPFFQNNNFWAQFECQMDFRLEKSKLFLCVRVFLFFVYNYDHQQLNNYYFFRL